MDRQVDGLRSNAVWLERLFLNTCLPLCPHHSPCLALLPLHSPNHYTECVYVVFLSACRLPLLCAYVNSTGLIHMNERMNKETDASVCTRGGMFSAVWKRAICTFSPTQLPSPYLAQLPLGSDCVLIS